MHKHIVCSYRDDGMTHARKQHTATQKKPTLTLHYYTNISK